MITLALRVFFTPSIYVATKLSRLMAPEPRVMNGYRHVARFKTSTRRHRRVS